MILKRDDVQKSAEKLVAKGKIEAAIKEYRKVLSKNPNDINILNRVGDLYARIQNNEDAVAVYAQIASKYAGDGFYVKAIAVYKKIQRIDSGLNLEVHRKLAELYQKQGLSNDARAQFKILAEHYHRNQDAASAIGIYQKLVGLEPQDPSHHVKLAELYYQQKLLDRALNEYAAIAKLMMAAGHFAEASKVYHRALDIDASDTDFIRNAIVSLKDAGQVDEARSLLTVARLRNPQVEGFTDLVHAIGEQKRSVSEDNPPGPGLSHRTESIPEAEPVKDSPVQPGALGNLRAEPAPSDPAPTPEAKMEAVEAPQEGDFEEFVLDLEDDEPPATLVSPPDDLVDAPGLNRTDFATGDVLPQAEAEHGTGRFDGAGTVTPAGEGPGSLEDRDDEGVEWAFGPTPELDLDVSPESPTTAEPLAPAPEPGEAIDQDLLARTAAELEPTAVRREDDLLAEAEVFIKYGLVEKASDRLQEVLLINSNHVGAYSQLIRVLLERAEHDRVLALATKMMQAARETGELEAWGEIHEALSASGYHFEGERPVAVPGADRAPEPPPVTMASGELAAVAPDVGQEPPGRADPAPMQEASGEFELAMDDVPAVDLQQEISLSQMFSDTEFDTAPEPEAPPPQTAQDAPQSNFEPHEPVAESNQPLESSGVFSPEPTAQPDPAAGDLWSVPETHDRFELGDQEDTLEILDSQPGAPLDDSMEFEMELEEADFPAPEAPGPEPQGLAPLAPSVSEAAATSTGEPQPPALSESGIHRVAAFQGGELSWLERKAATHKEKTGSDESLFAEEEQFFDLASELEQELGEPGARVAAPPEPKEPSLEEIVEGFKKGVAENLSPEDSDTHYNLGIAYREMGLLDEAIGEFQIAARDPGFLADSGSMLGQCFDAKGIPELAVKWYRKALSAADIGEHQTLAMLYDLGNAYLSLQDAASAYQTFVEIYGINTSYRDVASKLQALSRAAE